MVIEAIGVTGLVIAIFDQILKLGESTDQLISDIRAFDEVKLTCAPSIKCTIWQLLIADDTGHQTAAAANSR